MAYYGWPETNKKRASENETTDNRSSTLSQKSSTSAEKGVSCYHTNADQSTLKAQTSNFGFVETLQNYDYGYFKTTITFDSQTSQTALAIKTGHCFTHTNDHTAAAETHADIIIFGFSSLLNKPFANTKAHIHTNHNKGYS